jgi:hypothetical protein
MGSSQWIFPRRCLYFYFFFSIWRVISLYVSVEANNSHQRFHK